MSNKMIYRINGGTTVVEAAQMKHEGNLAYALGFLANHRLYKMSKNGGVTMKKAQAVIAEMSKAVLRFEEEVVFALGGQEEMKTISKLGKGEVVNPYSFVK